MKPLCIDLFCGLGGWAEGFLAETVQSGSESTPAPLPVVVQPQKLVIARSDTIPTMTPTLPPDIPKVKTTPLPADQQEALSQPWNPFNRLQHEAQMNAWLMAQTELSNAKRIKAYALAYADWKTNADIYASLNMPIPPAPFVPPLEDVGPMPSGYWFGQHV